MPTTFTFREGITDPIVFVLQEIDPDTEVASAVDLTGVTRVDLRLRSQDGTLSLNFATDDPGPQLEVTGAAAGEVTFTPAADDLERTYQAFDAFFEVTDATGTVISFPSDENFRLAVIGAF